MGTERRQHRIELVDESGGNESALRGPAQPHHRVVWRAGVGEDLRELPGELVVHHGKPGDDGVLERLAGAGEVAVERAGEPVGKQAPERRVLAVDAAEVAARDVEVAGRRAETAR